MKNIISVLLVFFIAANLAGCETMAKKFRRKKKEPVKVPRIYQVKKYEKKPSPELYKKHYAYWASWQSELVNCLGSNHKKDMRCIEEIIGNLKDMQNCLVPPKAAELAEHIERLEKAKAIIYNEELTQFNKDYVKRTLEKEDRFVRREFTYKKVKEYMKESFSDVPKEGR